MYSTGCCWCGTSIITPPCLLHLNTEGLNPGVDRSANTRYSPRGGSMLGQRRRRWTNIYPSLGECLVFAGDQHVFSDRDSNLFTGSFALALKFQRNKMFRPGCSLVRIQYYGEPPWLTGSDLESCVWMTVSSHSSHYPQEVLLAQFGLYVHNGGLIPH